MTTWDRPLRLGFGSRCEGSIEGPSAKVAVRGRVCHQHPRIGLNGRVTKGWTCTNERPGWVAREALGRQHGQAPTKTFRPPIRRGQDETWGPDHVVVVVRDILKGVATAGTGFRFGEALAEQANTCNELDMCFAVRRKGGRLIYALAIRVLRHA
jgi:hypothetical protein